MRKSILFLFAIVCAAFMAAPRATSQGKKVIWIFITLTPGGEAVLSLFYRTEQI